MSDPVAPGPERGAALEAGGPGGVPWRAGASVARRVWERLATSPLARRVAKGAFWSVLGAGLSRALALVAAILSARQLGVKAFGEYNLILTTAGMFQALAGFGLGTTATKFLSGKCRTDPIAAGRIVALARVVAIFIGALAMLGFLWTGPLIAARVLGAPQLGRALQLGSILLLFGSVNGAQFGILTGLERFRLVAIVTVSSAAVSIPLLVVGARRGGVIGCVGGFIASAVLTTLSYSCAVAAATRAEGIVSQYATALRAWRILFSFSLPATLSNLLLTPVTWITSAMLANAPGGFRELGLFSAANQWRNAMLLVATSAGAVLFPVFSDLHDAGRARALARSFWTSFVAVAASCLGGAVLLSLAAPWLMRAYGAEFRGASHVLVIMALAGALAALLNVAGYAISGMGRMWLGFALTAVWACVLVAVGWSLRTRGALGLSLAYFTAFFVHLSLAVGCAHLLLRRGVSAAMPVR